MTGLALFAGVKISERGESVFVWTTRGVFLWKWEDDMWA